MAPVVPDPRRIKSFESEAAFEKWLAGHHSRGGWIDGIRKGLDEKSFLQRYTLRGPKSIWSQINRDNIARLIAGGRMTQYGQRHIDAAKADGRWHAAYAPMAGMTAETLPADLRAAIESNPRARKTFRTLSRRNLFALESGRVVWLSSRRLLPIAHVSPPRVSARNWTVSDVPSAGSRAV